MLTFTKELLACIGLYGNNSGKSLHRTLSKSALLLFTFNMNVILVVNVVVVLFSVDLVPIRNQHRRST